MGNTQASNDSDLHRMLNWFLIQERLSAFCRIVDDKTFILLDEVFAAPATGAYNGRLTQESREDLIEKMEYNLGPGSNCGPTQHNFLNLHVDVIDDEHAKSRAYFYAIQYGVRRFEGQFWTTWGEYADSWVKTSDGWRISHRDYTTFFSDGPGEIVSRDP